MRELSQLPFGRIINGRSEQLIKIVIILVSSILAAFCYRAGGSGRWPRWLRVVGIPLLLALPVFLLGVHSWWVLLSIPLTIASISTYFDIWFNDTDNYWVHGFFVGLAAFPIAIATGHWIGFVVRCFILAVFMGIWCVVFKWDVFEETGRGASIPATLWMIC
jgi:hypothetical protein